MSFASFYKIGEQDGRYILFRGGAWYQWEGKDVRKGCRR
jgi:hypothetical protein